MLTIREALLEEAEVIANLHEKYLSTGFLASLGRKFLTLLYKAMISFEDTCVIVAVADDNIVGFVSGTVSVKGFYKYFLKKYLFQSVFFLIPYFIRPINLRKMVEVFLYSKTGVSELPEAELLSIVVDPRYHGRGVAKDLFISLTSYFRKKRIKRFKIVVGDKLERAKKFYKKMGCRDIATIEVHKGEISKVLVYDL